MRRRGTRLLRKFKIKFNAFTFSDATLPNVAESECIKFNLKLFATCNLPHVGERGNYNDKFPLSRRMARGTPKRKFNNNYCLTFFSTCNLSHVTKNICIEVIMVTFPQRVVGGTCEKVQIINLLFKLSPTFVLHTSVKGIFLDIFEDVGESQHIT